MAEEAVGVTVQQLAELWGLDERTVRKKAEEGVAVRVARGRYSMVKSTQNLIRALIKVASQHEDSAGSANTVSSSAMLKDKQRELLDLKLKQLRGTLISEPEIEEAWAAIMTTFRQGVLSLNSRISFRLPHLTGQDREVISQEIEEMLTAVSEWKTGDPAPRPVKEAPEGKE